MPRREFLWPRGYICTSHRVGLNPVALRSPRAWPECAHDEAVLRACAFGASRTTPGQFGRAAAREQQANLRQVQLTVKQYYILRTGLGEKHPDLAVTELARHAAVL